MTTTTALQALPLAAGTWEPDLAHSSIEFTVRHLGLSKVRGRFGAYSAALNVGTDIATTTVTADVDLSSVDTGNPDRDGHLQSADFFNVEQHPSMTFTSTRIETSGADEYRMIGDLTVNGVTHEVGFDVELTGSVTDDNGTRAGFSATTALSRRDFGISFDAPMGADAVLVGDKVNVELELQFVAA